MKRALLAVIVLLSLAAAATAQQQSNTEPKQQAPAAGQQPQQQQQQQPAPQPGTPGSAPGAQPGAPQAPGQPPAAGAPVKRAPAAKTQEELNAYQAIVTKTNPSEAEPLVADFDAKFAESELKPLVYEHLATLYFGTNQNDKALETGRKAVQMNPESVRSLIAVATVLADTTRETDLDKDERLAEADRDASKAVEVLESGGFPFPPNTPPEQAEQAKKMMLNMAYAALGSVETVRKNYPKAEQHYQKAIANAMQPDAVLHLRLSLIQDYQGKYADSLKNASRAMELAQPGSQVATYATRQRDRAAKLAASPAKPGASATSPQSTTMEPK